jgi:hypothetical protein
MQFHEMFLWRAFGFFTEVWGSTPKLFQHFYFFSAVHLNVICILGLCFILFDLGCITLTSDTRKGKLPCLSKWKQRSLISWIIATPTFIQIQIMFPAPCHNWTRPTRASLLLRCQLHLNVTYYLWGFRTFRGYTFHFSSHPVFIISLPSRYMTS